MSAPIPTPVEADIIGQLDNIKSMLEHAARAIGADRSAVITALLGALVALCVASEERDQLFAIVQDSIAQARALCLGPHITRPAVVH